MARNSNLQIRMDADERARIRRIARARDLADSTWARAILLREMRRIEAKEARKVATMRAEAATGGNDVSTSSSQLRRVAEPGTPPARKGR